MSVSPPRKRARACSENEDFMPEVTIDQSPNPSHNDKHCLECEEWREQHEKAHSEDIDAAYAKGCIDMASDRIAKWSNAFEGEKRKMEQDAYEEGIREGKSHMQECLDSRDEELEALREENVRLKQRNVLDRDKLQLYRRSIEELSETHCTDQRLLLARQKEIDALYKEVDTLYQYKEVAVNIRQNLRTQLEEQQTATGTEREALSVLDSMLGYFERSAQSCSNHQQKLANWRSLFAKHGTRLSQDQTQWRDKVCPATIRAFKALGLAMPDLFPPGFWNSLGEAQVEASRQQYMKPSSYREDMISQLQAQAQQLARFGQVLASQSNPASGPHLMPISVPSMPPGVQIFTSTSLPLPPVTPSMRPPGIPAIPECYGKRPKVLTEIEKLVFRVGSIYQGRRVLVLHPECVRNVPKEVPTRGRWVYIERPTPAVPLRKVAGGHGVPGWPNGDYDTNGDYLGI